MKFNMLGDANHAGPVRLSDVYSSAVGSAKDGVAASQRALYDAYNSLNSSLYSLYDGNIIPSNTDLNTIVQPGNYFSWVTIPLKNAPYSQACFIMKVECSAGYNNTSYIRQIFKNYANNIVWTRFCTPRSDMSREFSEWYTSESQIKYKDVTISSVTIGANGYADISQHFPSGMTRFLIAGVMTWSSSSKHVSFSITIDAHYLIGTGGDVITGLRIRYFYTD